MEPVPNHTPNEPDAYQYYGLTESEVDRLENENGGQPYDEVKNILWIKRNTLYSTALEEWDRKVTLLTDRVDRMEKRSGDLKNEIYQQVGFFSVFLGVVLTAVTQLTESEHPNCKKVWSPVVLTGLIWVVTVLGVWQKFTRIEEIDARHREEDTSRREVVRRANALRSRGEKFRFRRIKEKQKPENIKDKITFWIYKLAVMFSLSLFTGIFIASYFLILCDRGLAPIS